MIRVLLMPVMVILLAACTVEPEPILYGEDNCMHCQMTIMDHRYGTEIVTAKGKVYKFDSIECLVEFFVEKNTGNEEFSLILFTPYNQPGKLVDVHKSHVLHSRNLPSPMGMYLTAFETENEALSFKEKNGGKVYDWEGLLENYKLIRTVGR